MNVIDTSARRILLIDDQESIHEDYRKVLARPKHACEAFDQAASDLFSEPPAVLSSWKEFELDSAFQGQEGLEFVRRSLEAGRPYSMAFVDVRMPPGWDGVQTVRRIWEVDPEILIVICSAYSDYSWEEMVSQLGRNDRFLILKKPFDNMEVQQCAVVLAERWSVARTDVLTGLLNRRAFQAHAQIEWSRSQRHHLPLACAMLDLDFFKNVNDKFGHTAGDIVLKVIAGHLQKQRRPSDSVCRHGGEEFCILLPHADEEGGASWAEKARQAIAAIPITIGDRQIKVTASIGVAERLVEGDSIDLLMDRADQALLLAKRAGRNRVVRSSGAATPPCGTAPPEVFAPADGSHSVLIRDAQAIVRCAADLAESISSRVEVTAPPEFERIHKLQELIQRLLAGLQQPNALVAEEEVAIKPFATPDVDALVNQE